jgi:hypothetical protein
MGSLFWTQLVLAWRKNFRFVASLFPAKMQLRYPLPGNQRGSRLDRFHRNVNSPKPDYADPIRS